MTHLGSTFASGLAMFALALSPCGSVVDLPVSFLACCFGCMMTVGSDEKKMRLVAVDTRLQQAHKQIHDCTRVVSRACNGLVTLLNSNWAETSNSPQ